MKGVLAIFTDFGIEVVWAGSHEVGASLLKRILIVHDLLQISLRLLVVKVFPLHAHPLIFECTFGLETAPVTLHQDHSMFFLFLNYIVYIACVQVLNEIVLSAHGLNPLLNLVTLLEQSSLLSLELVELIVLHRN